MSECERSTLEETREGVSTFNGIKTIVRSPISAILPTIMTLFLVRPDLYCYIKRTRLGKRSPGSAANPCFREYSDTAKSPCSQTPADTDVLARGRIAQPNVSHTVDLTSKEQRTVSGGAPRSRHDNLDSTTYIRSAEVTRVELKSCTREEVGKGRETILKKSTESAIEKNR